MRLWNTEPRSPAQVAESFESTGIRRHVHDVHESFSALPLDTTMETGENQERFSTQLAAQSERARNALSDSNLHTPSLDGQRDLSVYGYGDALAAIVTTLSFLGFVAAPIALGLYLLLSGNLWQGAIMIGSGLVFLLFAFSRPR